MVDAILQLFASSFLLCFRFPFRFVCAAFSIYICFLCLPIPSIPPTSVLCMRAKLKP
ncbi:hypothetical protein BDV19DRAFT_355896 [Aspergillus venezuelensis]